MSSNCYSRVTKIFSYDFFQRYHSVFFIRFRSVVKWSILSWFFVWCEVRVEVLFARGISSYSSIICWKDLCSSLSLSKIYWTYWMYVCSMACRILVPQLGVEPGPLAGKERSPDHWTAREFPMFYSFDLPTSATSTKSWLLKSYCISWNQDKLSTLFFFKIVLALRVLCISI